MRCRNDRSGKADQEDKRPRTDDRGTIRSAGTSLVLRRPIVLSCAVYTALPLPVAILLAAVTGIDCGLLLREAPLARLSGSPALSLREGLPRPTAAGTGAGAPTLK